jgi:hypothetical protein
MSYSTQVRVTVGMTSIEYTFGSGSKAYDYGITVPLQSKSFNGREARNLIEHTDVLPEDELEFARKILARHTAELLEFNDGQEPEEMGYDIWVEVKLFD